MVGTNVCSPASVALLPDGVKQEKRPLSRPPSHMRWRGLEPPRGVNPTRPSTLRVYQFRHQRAGRIVAAAPAHSAVGFRPVRRLCEEGVSAALAAGASYADARAIVRRAQLVSTKNRR